MKFLSLSLFAAAVMGQASVISDAITTIGQRTQALDAAVNSFSGPGDITSLQNAATAVINAINTGNTNVQGIDPIDSTAALTLVDPINTLAGQVDTAVNDLIAKKSALSAETNVVNQNLNQILDATNTFSATVFGKIPDALVPTAMNLVQPIIDDLNRAIAQFPMGATSSTTSMMTSSTSMMGSTSTTSVESSMATSMMMGSSSVPVYPTTSMAMSSAAVTTMLTSGTGSIIVPTTTVSPPITSATTPAPFTGGASQLTGGFAAAVVAAAVAVAAF